MFSSVLDEVSPEYNDKVNMYKVDIESVGKKLQSNDIFPESINVEFACILKDKTYNILINELDRR